VSIPARRALDYLPASLESINEQIDQLEEAIDEYIQGCQSLARRQELLETIPRVGQTTVTVVIAEPGARAP
jgi:exonuclease VII small subunit